MVKLGILAGGGDLPTTLIEYCQSQGRDVFVAAFRGQWDSPLIREVDHAEVDIAQVGKTVKLLKNKGCQELVLAGRLKRPTLSEIKPDWGGVKLLNRLRKVWGQDDALLTAVIEALEEEGFKVVGADDVMGDLTAQGGLLTATKPDDGAEADIKRGVGVLDALSQVDVGQAVVVCNSIVLGVEAIEGTAALINRAGGLKDAPGGVLVKLAKEGQSMRVDKPTVGLETVQQLKAAGLAGMAIQEGGCMLMDKAAAIQAADEAGLFIQVINPEDYRDA